MNVLEACSVRHLFGMCSTCVRHKVLAWSLTVNSYRIPQAAAEIGRWLSYIQGERGRPTFKGRGVGLHSRGEGLAYSQGGGVDLHSRGEGLAYTQGGKGWPTVKGEGSAYIQGERGWSVDYWAWRSSCRGRWFCLWRMSVLTQVWYFGGSRIKPKQISAVYFCAVAQIEFVHLMRQRIGKPQEMIGTSLRVGDVT